MSPRRPTRSPGVSQGSGADRRPGRDPPQARPTAAHAVRASFTAGLNEVFLVGAILALVAAVLTLVLIRSKDFESGAARGGPQPHAAGPAPTEPPATTGQPTPSDHPAPAQPA